MLKKIFIILFLSLSLSGKVLADDFSQSMSAISPLLGTPEMQAYSLEVGQKIIKNFDLPQTNENLATIVTFTVDKNGKLIDYEITQSSGNQNYDNMVISAIKQSSPYPAPTFNDGEELGVVLNMDLNVLKLIKMLSDSNLDLNMDFNLDSFFQMEEPSVQEKNPARKQPAQTNQKTPQIHNPSGKKFINPYEIEKSLD